jgi:RHS repeat-associated protein
MHSFRFGIMRRRPLSIHTRYDAFNRWVGETIMANGTTTQTRYVYDGSQIVLQFDGTGGSDLAAANLSHRYLWGPAVDQLLADEQLLPSTSGGGAGGEGYNLSQPGNIVWTLGDNENTIRDLATYNAGQTTIVNHRVFSAYGQLLSQTNPSTLSPATVDCLFAYTGKAFDTATGLQNNDNRWYNSITGRWLSQDPSGLAPDTNSYRYCGNGPTSEDDPSGLGPWDDLPTEMKGTPWTPSLQTYNSILTTALGLAGKIPFGRAGAKDSVTGNIRISGLDTGNVDEVKKKCEKIGHAAREEKDYGHAEKKVSLVAEGIIVVVPFTVCQDCLKYFAKLAKANAREYIVADHKYIWKFYSNGTVAPPVPNSQGGEFPIK